MLKADEGLFLDDMEAGSVNLSSLLAAAVVVDSYFFKEELRGKKWTEQDTEAHEWLMKFADVGHAFWHDLNNIKFDYQASLSLGLEGIFIRDFKQYELESGVMGVSVAVGTVEGLVSHFGSEAFGAACREYTLKRELGVFVIMSI